MSGLPERWHHHEPEPGPVVSTPAAAVAQLAAMRDLARLHLAPLWLQLLEFRVDGTRVARLWEVVEASSAEVDTWEIEPGAAVHADGRRLRPEVVTLAVQAAWWRRNGERLIALSMADLDRPEIGPREVADDAGWIMTHLAHQLDRQRSAWLQGWRRPPGGDAWRVTR